MERRACWILLLAAACGSTRFDIEKGPDPLYLRVGEAVVLDAEGEGVTVTFLGRTFVFPEGFSSFQGTVAADAVLLRSGDLEVRISPQEIRVEEGDRALFRRLDELPPGARVVYADEGLRVEP